MPPLASLAFLLRYYIIALDSVAYQYKFVHAKFGKESCKMHNSRGAFHRKKR